MHCAVNSISTLDSLSTFSSSRHSVSPKSPEWYWVKTLEIAEPKVFSTLNSTWVVFWKVMVTGGAGYIVSPSMSIKIGSEGGHNVGESVGESVDKLGPSDGTRDGPSEGMRDGPSDGARDGPSEGMRDGLGVGPPVGAAVGDKLGPSDGARDGPSEGRAEGLSTGDELGSALAVGDSLGAEL